MILHNMQIRSIHQDTNKSPTESCTRKCFNKLEHAWLHFDICCLCVCGDLLTSVALNYYSNQTKTMQYHHGHNYERCIKNWIHTCPISVCLLQTAAWPDPHDATFLILGKPRETRESLISLETEPGAEHIDNGGWENVVCGERANEVAPAGPPAEDGIQTEQPLIIKNFW